MPKFTQTGIWDGIAWHSFKILFLVRYLSLLFLQFLWPTLVCVGEMVEQAIKQDVAFHSSSIILPFSSSLSILSFKLIETNIIPCFEVHFSSMLFLRYCIFDLGGYSGCEGDSGATA